MKARAFNGCTECRMEWPCRYAEKQIIIGGSREVPGPACPFPDVPIPRGTERMKAIEWKRAWDFIEKLK
jgi:hypothetical protein